MESHLTEIMDYLLTQSWQIAILVAAAAVVSWLLRNKSAHARYLLWLIVLAKCLVPPLVTVPLAVLPQERPVLLLETPPPVISEPVASPPVPDARPGVPSVAQVRTRLNVRPLLGIGWITGVSVFVLVAMTKALQTISWLRRERKPLPAELHSTIQRLFSDFRTLPKLWLIDGIGQPFVWGLLRGSIYLPANFVRVDSAEHRRGILGHELSHILRFDAAVNLLQVVAQAIFWFHPFVWWANKKIRGEREKCCDEMAIARLGAKVRDYSIAIVNILISEQESTRPVPSLAVAGPVKNIEERIKTMLRPGKKFYKRPSLVAVTVAVLLALLIVPMALVLTARAETKPSGEQKTEPAKSLHQAAAAGDIEQVKLLISQGADVNARDPNGYTPLYYAIWSDNEETVRILVSRGADVNRRANEKDYPPLIYAIWESKNGVVKALLDGGANTNIEDESGYTPLYWAAFTSGKDVLDLILAKGNYPVTVHLAACKGDLAKVKAFVEEGADVNVKDQCGCTPLHWAALANTPELADFLIGKGADLNARDGLGFTPLLNARELPVLELLISKGADVQATTQQGLTTKLHMACLAGSKNVVDLLIRKGADVNQRNRSGTTPLWLAASGGHPAIVQLLIDKGADVNVKTNRGRSALGQAINRGHAEVVELLRKHGAKESLHDVMGAGDIDQVKQILSQGADVNAKDGNGQTPLHVAVLAGRKDIVELLIADGADINAKANTWDTTPLIAAINIGHKDIAELLITKGADVRARGRGDYTPLHCAAMNRARMTGSTDTMKLLLARGADIEARQEHGATPLACATFDGNTESADFLLEHGANIEARTNGGESSETPLLRAVRQEHVETAKLLLAKGANIHARWRRLTALHVAMMGDQLSKRESDKEMVKLLIEKGLELPAIHMAAYSGHLEKVRNYIADGTKIEEKDAAAYTALHCAVCGGHKAIVEFLLSKGAGVNAKTTNGWTPLRFAWTVDMAAFLIANGADVRVAGELGDTSLHQAVNRNDHKGDKALIELLLKHGADVNATSVGWEGWTAFHVACRNGAQDIVELLLAHGADVNAKTEKGITPLSLAKESGRQQIIELLRKHGAKE